MEGILDVIDSSSFLLTPWLDVLNNPDIVVTPATPAINTADRKVSFAEQVEVYRPLSDDTTQIYRSQG